MAAYSAGAPAPPALNLLASAKRVGDAEGDWFHDDDDDDDHADDDDVNADNDHYGHHHDSSCKYKYCI